MTQHIVITTAQQILLDVACARLEQFSTSHEQHVGALALLAEEALHEAITAGVSTHRLAAELDLSTHALTAILNGNPKLLQLHPLRARENG